MGLGGGGGGTFQHYTNMAPTTHGAVHPAPQHAACPAPLQPSLSPPLLQPPPTHPPTQHPTHPVKPPTHLYLTRSRVTSAAGTPSAMAVRFTPSGSPRYCPHTPASAALVTRLQYSSSSRYSGSRTSSIADTFVGGAGGGERKEEGRQDQHVTCVIGHQTGHAEKTSSTTMYSHTWHTTSCLPSRPPLPPPPKLLHPACRALQQERRGAAAPAAAPCFQGSLGTPPPPPDCHSKATLTWPRRRCRPSCAAAARHRPPHHHRWRHPGDAACGPPPAPPRAAACAPAGSRARGRGAGWRAVNRARGRAVNVGKGGGGRSSETAQVSCRV